MGWLWQHIRYFVCSTCHLRSSCPDLRSSSADLCCATNLCCPSPDLRSSGADLCCATNLCCPSADLCFSSSDLCYSSSDLCCPSVVWHHLHGCIPRASASTCASTSST